MRATSINGDRYGATAVSSSRFCNVNIVMTRGQVSAVNYIGPTGGSLRSASNVRTSLNAARRLAEVRASSLLTAGNQFRDQHARARETPA